MKTSFYAPKIKILSPNFIISLIFLLLLTFLVYQNHSIGQPAISEQNTRKIPSPASEIDLKVIPYKLLYETYRSTDGRDNWEIYSINADGSEPVNLTNTPDIDEMYPHVSPDGTKICFVTDVGTNRRDKVRSVCYMNIDGTGRVEVARNARQPCWGPDSKTIAYLKGEYDRYNTSEYASSGLYFYNIDTKMHTQHPNRTLEHLYAICWSPDGNWFLAVVKGTSDYSDAILAIQANGPGIFDLAKWGVVGCRPDFSPDGTMMTWGQTDWQLNIAQISFNGPEPVVSNIRKIVECTRSAKIYHVDFSPDGKYIAFSYGSSRGYQNVGGFADGWDICLTDLSGKWYQITRDGHHNKEPDWAPLVAVKETTDD